MSLERENHPAITALAFGNDEGSLYCFRGPKKTEINPVSSTSFPISDLPSELRTEIFAHYFASLPPLSITPDNVTSEIHNRTDLSLSSPYFESDILASISSQIAHSPSRTLKFSETSREEKEETESQE
jgi:hypothetical protein